MRGLGSGAGLLPNQLQPTAGQSAPVLASLVKGSFYVAAHV
jgi:hypothetical protein